jgi:lipopolysaccharide cholinephosphotransferase
MNKVNFDTLFPDNRREGETTIRQAHLVMLRMLKVIDYLCRKHGLRYWLCSGTLLGAVRHKGFIPWDDDLDISMLRDDYDRFVAIAAEELPDDMMLQTRETDPYYHYLPLPCKIRDKKSFTLSPGYEGDRCAKGLFVDIFPVDRFHTEPLALGFEKTVKAYNMFISKSWDSIHFAHESLIRRTLAYFHPFFHFLLLRYGKLSRKLIARNRQLGDHCLLGAGFDTIWRRYYRFDEIYPLIEVEFEDARFFAPQNPHIYLKAIYGDDYMTLPPESKRTQHATVLRPVL